MINFLKIQDSRMSFLICSILFLQFLLYKSKSIGRIGLPFFSENSLSIISIFIGFISVVYFVLIIFIKKKNNIKSLLKITTLDKVVFIFVLYILIDTIIINSTLLKIQFLFSLIQYMILVLIIFQNNDPFLLKKLSNTLYVVFIFDLIIISTSLLTFGISKALVSYFGMCFYVFPILLGYSILQKKYYHYITTLICASIVFMSGFRRGWLFIIFTIIFYIIILERKYTRKLILFSICSLITFFFLISYNSIDSNLAIKLIQTSKIIQGDYVSGATGRDELWRIGIEVGKESPFFGNGFRNTSELFRKATFGTRFNKAGRAHNIYIELFGDFGIFGLINYSLILIVFIFSYVPLFKFFKTSHIMTNHLFYSLMIFSLFISLNIIGIFGWGGIYNKEFWIYLAVSMTFLRISEYQILKTKQIIKNEQ